MKKHRHSVSSQTVFALLVSALAPISQAAEITDSNFNASANYAENVSFDLANDYSYSGVISGIGVTLSKSGAGTLSVLNAQTYTGATSISGGTLAINSLANLASSSGITLSNGGTLKYTSTNNAALGPVLTVTDTGTVEFNQTTTNTLTLNLAGSGTLTLAGHSNPGGSSEVSSFIISPSSSFTGTVKITGGKVKLNMTPLKAGTFELDGGTIMNNLEMNVSSDSFIVPQTLVLGENGGSVRVGFGASRLIWGGKITGTGPLGITGDSGFMVLANSENDFSGGILIGSTLNGGSSNCRVVLGADNSLGTGAVSFGSENTDSNYLDLAGFSLTSRPIAGLSASVPSVRVQNSSSNVSTLTVAPAAGESYTYAGQMAGAINFVMDGEGTQILSGEGIKYTGTTTAKGGTLLFDASAKTGPSSDFILDGGGIGIAAADKNVSLKVQDGGGTFLWNAGGTTAVNFQITGDGAAADTVLTLKGITNPTSNCNTFTLAAVSNYAGKINLAGGKLNLTSGAGFQMGGYLLSGGTLMLNRGGSHTFAVPMEVTSAGGSVRAGSSGTYTLTGKITGTGELGISGDNGVIVLANSANDFSGGLNVGVSYNIGGDNRAYVRLGADNALGSGVLTLSKSNDTVLNLNGFSVTSRPIAGLSASDASVTLKNGASKASTLTMNTAEGKSYTYAGKMTAGINLVKDGAGTQILSGTGINHKGSINVKAGTLKYDSAAGLGKGLITLSGNSAVLDLGGTSDTSGDLTGLVSSNSGAQIINSSEKASKVTLNAPAGQSSKYAGKISGAVELVKDGEGTQTLSGEGIKYTGATTAKGGTLLFDAAAGTGTSSGFILAGGTVGFAAADRTLPLTVQAGGGTLRWDAGGTGAITLNVTGSGTTEDTVLTLKGITNPTSNCNTFVLGALSNFTGKIELAGGKLNMNSSVGFNTNDFIFSGGTLMINRGGTFTLTSSIEVTSAGGSIRSGSYGTHILTGKITGAGELGISGDNGIVVLSNSANDFSGGLNIGVSYNIGGENEAKVRLGADGALGTGTVTLSKSKNTILNLNGFSASEEKPIAGLSASESSVQLKNLAEKTSTLAISVPEGETYTYAGISEGPIEFVKMGAGTQILSGTFTNADSLQMRIESGLLTLADNSAMDLGGADISVESNGVLGLSDVTITNLDSLSMTMDSLLFIDPNSESVNLSTDTFLGKDGNFTLAWDGLADTLTGSIADYLVSVGNGYYGFQEGPSDSGAVPEPASWLLLVLAAGMLALRRKPAVK